MRQTSPVRPPASGDTTSIDHSGYSRLRGVAITVPTIRRKPAIVERPSLSTTCRSSEKLGSSTQAGRAGPGSSRSRQLRRRAEPLLDMPADLVLRCARRR